jgi:hypothetical protein
MPELAGEEVHDLGLARERPVRDLAVGRRGRVLGVDREVVEAQVDRVVHPQPVRRPVGAQDELPDRGRGQVGATSGPGRSRHVVQRP